MRLGKDLAKTYNVLYLNLEMYGGIGGHFPEIGQTVADALYYSRQEKKQFKSSTCGYGESIWGRLTIFCQ